MLYKHQLLAIAEYPAALAIRECRTRWYFRKWWRCEQVHLLAHVDLHDMGVRDPVAPLG